MTLDALACFCISQRNFKLIISDRNRKERLVKDCAIFEMFGEKALMESRPRAASTMQTTEIMVLQLSRKEFKRQLGSPMSQLQARQYNLGLWKLLVDFTGRATPTSPWAACRQPSRRRTPPPRPQGFVVYRPCSQESIAEMIGMVGVGNGSDCEGKQQMS